MLSTSWACIVATWITTMVLTAEFHGGWCSFMCKKQKRDLPCSVGSIVLLLLPLHSNNCHDDGYYRHESCCCNRWRERIRIRYQ